MIDFDELESGRTADALRGVRRREVEAGAVYRGWMLTADTYRLLYNGLSERGLRLRTAPASYRRCHYFSGWCEALRPFAADYRIVPADIAGDPDALISALASFGGRSLVVKDEVKSVPGADFIRDSRDAGEVSAVVAKLLDECDGRPAGGIVFREALDFVRGGDRVAEVRSFVVGGEVVCAAPRQSVDAGHPPGDWLRSVADAVDSPFFTIDAAVTTDGQWRVVEIGDGQVSERPPRLDPTSIVRAIEA